jgi:hypothetical protein
MPQARKPHTLGTSLSLFALACTVPVVAVAIGLVYFLLSESYARTQAELVDRRDLMANAVELRIQNVVEDLQVLAASPALRTRDFQSFRDHMVEAGNLLGAFGIVLVDREGQLLISTRRQFGESLPKRANLSTQVEFIFEITSSFMKHLIRLQSISSSSKG